MHTPDNILITKHHLLSAGGMGFTHIRNISAVSLRSDREIKIMRGHLYAVTTSNTVGNNTFIGSMSTVYGMNDVLNILHNANTRDALIDAYWTLDIPSYLPAPLSGS